MPVPVLLANDTTATEAVALRFARLNPLNRGFALAKTGGGRAGTRTLDPLIKSQLLYQLSYASSDDNYIRFSAKCKFLSFTPFYHLSWFINGDSFCIKLMVPIMPPILPCRLPPIMSNPLVISPIILPSLSNIPPPELPPQP